MFEHKRQPLASRQKFIRRVVRSVAFSAGLIVVCLFIGILGYHYIAHLAWIDSLHNASMILSGMGPVASIDNDAGKYFSSFYALFSGIIFIGNVGIILAPLAHRLIHKLNLEE